MEVGGKGQLVGVRSCTHIYRNCEIHTSTGHTSSACVDHAVLVTRLACIYTLIPSACKKRTHNRESHLMCKT